MNNQQLVDFLKNQNKEGASFLDKIKIAYRPLVCPFKELLEMLPEKASVFDIGCGSGMFLSLVKEFRNPIQLAGIEITPQLIDNAKKVLDSQNTNTKLEVFDGKKIPDFVSEFDFIFMIDVFHHIPKGQQWAFLDQLFDKMKNGAKLIFKDIEGSHPLKYWNKVHDSLLAGEIGHEVSSKKVKQYIEPKTNLSILHFSKKRMLLYPHYTFVIEKN
ncbi:MAG: class I SAM-dependent methyltransferase [Vicingaceae bacterium]